MAERIRAFGIVTLLTLIVWLFAESESLTKSELSAAVQVTVGAADRDKYLVSPVEFPEGRVTIELRGAQSAINRAGQLLQTPIRITPGSPAGIPTVEGIHIIRMLDFLNAWPELAATGASVDYVTPPQIRVEVQELRTVPLTPVAQLTGIAIDGDVRFTPPEISVLMPTLLAESSQRAATIAIPISPASSQTRLTPGAQEITVPIQLPRDLADQRGVSLLTTELKARFTVVDTNITERFTAVPVQVVAPPIEIQDWTIAVDPEDAILQVDVRGPRAAIEPLKDPDISLVAVVSLRDVDFTADGVTKPIRFMILRDGAITPVPPSLEVLSEKTEVRVRAIRRTEQP